MSTFGAGSTGAYIAAGVVVAGVAAGGYMYVKTQNAAAPSEVVVETVVEPVVVTDAPAAPVVNTPEPEPETPVIEIAEAPVVETPDTPEVITTETTTPDVVDVAPVPPTFDVVRIDTDGNAVIAGLAAARSEVFVFLDQTEIAKSPADGRGNFVALATVEPSDVPRTLSLVMRVDGVDTPSEATIVVAPSPIVVAAAAPETVPETPTETPAPIVEPVAEIAAAPAEPTVAPAAADPAPKPTPAAPEAPEPIVVAAADPVETTVVIETTPVPTVVPAPVPTVVPTPVVEPVQPPKPQTILLADGDGVRVLQGADTIIPTEITIDAISYGADGDAVLTGRGGAGMVARAYLNNARVGDTTIGEAGDWTLTLTDVDAGIYTLRVDQIDDTGAVVSRYETPFKREDPAVLVAAVTDPEPTSIKDPIAVEPSAPVAPVQDIAVVTVQPGFTLWKIAKDAYGQGDLYVQVFDANKDAIADPDLIYPGQVFEVPRSNVE